MQGAKKQNADVPQRQGRIDPPRDETVPLIQQVPEPRGAHVFRPAGVGRAGSGAHDQLVLGAEQIRILGAFEGRSALHELQQDAVIGHALHGEIAHDLLLESARRQAVLVEARFTIIETKAVHGRFDGIPKIGDCQSALFPGVLACAVDIGPAHRVAGGTHFGVAVNNRNVKKLSQCATSLPGFLERSAPSSRMAVWKCSARMTKPSRVAERAAGDSRNSRIAARLALRQISSISAPLHPSLAVPANAARSTPAASGLPRVCTLKISSRAAASGNGNSSMKSKRPARSSASSTMSRRFVAASTTTPVSASMPSISVRSWAIARSVTAVASPPPRRGAMLSISSRKMMQGEASFALWKMSRTARSVSPTHRLIKAGPLTVMPFQGRAVEARSIYEAVDVKHRHEPRTSSSAGSLARVLRICCAVSTDDTSTFNPT